MFIDEPAPFIKEFVEALDASLRQIEPIAGLSTLQKKWLAFCMLAIVVTNSVCWAKFERASLGNYSLAALSWMFRQAQVNWSLILSASVKVILWRYPLTTGVLVLDDSEKRRAKTRNRPRIRATRRNRHREITSAACQRIGASASMGHLLVIRSMSASSWRTRTMWWR